MIYWYNQMIGHKLGRTFQVSISNFLLVFEIFCSLHWYHLRPHTESLSLFLPLSLSPFLRREAQKARVWYSSTPTFLSSANLIRDITQFSTSGADFFKNAYFKVNYYEILSSHSDMWCQTNKTNTFSSVWCRGTQKTLPPRFGTSSMSTLFGQFKVLTPGEHIRLIDVSVNVLGLKKTVILSQTGLDKWKTSKSILHIYWHFNSVASLSAFGCF